MKKYGILVTLLLLVSLVSIYFVNNNKSTRAPSSISSDKEQIISKIRWSIKNHESEFFLDLNCQEWSSLEVTLKSEGVAYSGEPVRVIQTSLCGESFEGFYQIWPHNLNDTHERIQKISFVDEMPPEWTLEKIKIFGDLGMVEISAVEIYQSTGEIFIFEAQ